MQARNVVLLITVLLLFSLLVVGAYVTADPLAGEACGTSASWPLCNGQLFPTGNVHMIAEYAHRLLAILSATFLFITLAIHWKGKSAPSTKYLLLAATALVLFEIGLGDAVVGAELDPAIVALHQAIGVAIFGLTLSAFVVAQRPVNGFNAQTQ